MDWFIKLIYKYYVFHPELKYHSFQAFTYLKMRKKLEKKKIINLFLSRYLSFILLHSFAPMIL